MYGPRMYYGVKTVQSEKWRCHFCQERLWVAEYDPDEFGEEVGEFWSEVLKESVIAHPDCLPMGADATLRGEDPEWKMA